MTLQAGVRVNLLSPSLSSDCLAVSSGVVPLTVGGAAGAVVARGDWRPLDADEIAVLIADHPSPLRSSVSVFDLGEQGLAQARRTLLPLLTGDGDGDDEGRQTPLRAFQMTVLEALYRTHGLVPESVGAADLVANLPGRESTAFNKRTGELMGLHVDSHQRLPFGERDRAMTLCAVNIGLGERYFTFLNQPMSWVLDQLGLCEAPGSAWELKQLFFDRFPDHPMIRITLQPGHGYLCNTQNTFHDGATRPGNVPDVAFLSMASFLGDDLVRAV